VKIKSSVCLLLILTLYLFPSSNKCIGDTVVKHWGYIELLLGLVIYIYIGFSVSLRKKFPINLSVSYLFVYSV